jgi:uncharacterized membrane protein YidH (DUF202 family)
MTIVLAIVLIMQSIILLIAAWVIWQQANRLNERRRPQGRVSQMNERPLPRPEEEFVAEVRRILHQ